MDFNAIDITAIITGFGALLKAWRSDARAEEIQADRKTTKENLDVWRRETELKLIEHEKRLNEGGQRFDKMDEKLDDINNAQKELFGQFKELKGLIMGMNQNNNGWGK